MSRATLAFEAYGRAEKALYALFRDPSVSDVVRETLRLVLVELTPTRLLLAEAAVQDMKPAVETKKKGLR